MAMPIMFTSRDGEAGRLESDGLGERRQPDAGRERRRLVMDVDDLRFPLAPEILHQARLDHVEHVAVAVVVVADVFLIEAAAVPTDS